MELMEVWNPSERRSHGWGGSKLKERVGPSVWKTEWNRRTYDSSCIQKRLNAGLQGELMSLIHIAKVKALTLSRSISAA